MTKYWTSTATDGGVICVVRKIDGGSYERVGEAEPDKWVSPVGLAAHFVGEDNLAFDDATRDEAAKALAAIGSSVSVD